MCATSMPLSEGIPGAGPGTSDLAPRVIGPRAARFQRPPGDLDLGPRVSMRVQHVGGLGGVLIDRAEVGQ
jgi:hypothetical protein